MDLDKTNEATAKKIIDTDRRRRRRRPTHCHPGRPNYRAAPSGQLKPSRYFFALAPILIVLYRLVYFTGDRKAHQAGLDLQGGTSITLTGTPTGGRTDQR